MTFGRIRRPDRRDAVVLAATLLFPVGAWLVFRDAPLWQYLLGWVAGLVAALVLDFLGVLEPLFRPLGWAVGSLIVWAHGRWCRRCR